MTPLSLWVGAGAALLAMLLATDGTIIYHSPPTDRDSTGRDSANATVPPGRHPGVTGHPLAGGVPAPHSGSPVLDQGQAGPAGSGHPAPTSPPHAPAEAIVPGVLGPVVQPLTGLTTLLVKAINGLHDQVDPPKPTGTPPR
ncbi:hypothetical protein D5S17_17245 [Pseudonocardiaceae bacterium YIM PH 21723]|nr:hypothetical protein D5S17_17245 [Pseudonocardiaceae bacterium YIM PH 21723]